MTSNGANNDNQVVKSLFSALRTSIPQDVRLDLVRTSPEELKFIVAVQPRVCSFAHRKRHSLRHPALSMATKRFYCYRRKRHQEELRLLRAKAKARAALARMNGGDGASMSGDEDADDEDAIFTAMMSEYSKSSDNRRAVSPRSAGRPRSSISHASARYLSRSIVDGMSDEDDDDMWSEFGGSMSSAAWNYHRVNSASGSVHRMGSSEFGQLGGSSRYGMRRTSVGQLRSANSSSGGPEAISALRGAKPFMRLLDLTSSETNTEESAGNYSQRLQQMRRRRAGGSTSSRPLRGGGKSRSSAGANRTSTAANGLSTDEEDMAIAGMPMASRRRLNVQGGYELMDETEEEEYLRFQQNESSRWAQLAYCYDQMLRSASKTVKVAALTAALDALVNDIIRRFWDRITVSPAAMDAHQRAVASGGGSARDSLVSSAETSLVDMVAATAAFNGETVNPLGDAFKSTDGDIAQSSGAGGTGGGGRSSAGNSHGLNPLPPARVTSDGKKDTTAAVMGKDKKKKQVGRQAAATTATTNGVGSAVNRNKKKGSTVTASPPHTGAPRKSTIRRGKGALANGRQTGGDSGDTSAADSKDQQWDSNGNSEESDLARRESPSVDYTDNTSYDPIKMSSIEEDIMRDEDWENRDSPLELKKEVTTTSCWLVGEEHQSNSTTPAKKRRRRAPLPATALYLTPLQYTYLNTRIASVLLPDNHELSVEMLQSVQEDLMADAEYRENDPQQEHYFGVPPRLVPPPGSNIAVTPTSGMGGGGSNGRRTPGRRSGRRRSDYGGQQGNFAGWNIETPSLGRTSHMAYTDDDKIIHCDAVVPWDAGRLPSLTYGQFWYSMMELADNWTFSAAQPGEYAIFLLELYSEVFGHDWDDEDEQLLQALRMSMADYVDATDLLRETEEALHSFNDLVHQLDDWSSSEDGEMGGKRRRKGIDDSSSVGSATSSSAARREKDGIAEGETSNDDSRSDASSRDDWKYIQRIGPDGKIVNLRWREYCQPSRHRKYREAFKLACGEDIEDLSDHSSDLSYYVIEEYLNDENEIIRRRRLHRHMTYHQDQRKRDRNVDGGEGGSDDSSEDYDASSGDDFMYNEVQGMGDSKFRSRKFFDEPSRRTRRLEGSVRKDDYADTYEDNLSLSDSWSSFGDGEYSDSSPMDFATFSSQLSDTANDGSREVDSWSRTQRSSDEDRDERTMSGRGKRQKRPGQLPTEAERQVRRRFRVRRSGKRRDRRRFGRNAEYYYQMRRGGEQYRRYRAGGNIHGSASGGENNESSFATGNISSNSTLQSNFSHSTASDVPVTPRKLRSAKDREKKGGDSSGGGAPSPEITELTDQQRRELLEKKEWLQAVLAAKGIHIADATFGDPSEEVNLYELLQLAEKWEQRKRNKADGGGGDEDGDMGSADFDAVLLARIFAKPHAYTIDELQKSELMAKLLAMGEDGDGKGRLALTSEQIGNVLKALMNPNNHKKVIETTSMRLRRERMIAEAKKLQKQLQEREKEKRRAEREERHRTKREAAIAAAAAARKAKEEEEMFNLTKVPEAPDPLPRPPRPSSMGDARDAGGTAGGDVVLATRLGSAGRITTPLPISALERPLESPEPGVPTLDPLTRAQRKEQNRLFKEFEAFCEAEASKGGKYKVSFSYYTPDQFEAFFLHLHLGPYEQALLKGRAPLAPGTSLVSGAYGQLLPRIDTVYETAAGGGAAAAGSMRTRYGFLFGSSAVTAGALVPQPPQQQQEEGIELRPAPVKLFTLTTHTSLESAIEENYHSYLENRAFHETSGIAGAQGRGGMARGGGLQRGRPLTQPRFRQATSAGEKLPPYRSSNTSGGGGGRLSWVPSASVTNSMSEANGSDRSNGRLGHTNPMQLPQLTKMSSLSLPQLDKASKIPPSLNRSDLEMASQGQF